jgi:hypothetical protein
MQHCKGSAFYMNKGKIFKININSRVAVDAAFFHEMQPNYSRPSLRDLGVKDKNGIAVIDIGAMLMEDREREKERMQGDGVDAQKLSARLNRCSSGEHLQRTSFVDTVQMGRRIRGNDYKQ